MPDPTSKPYLSPINHFYLSADYSYGFNGKDRESEFSSGAYDFGARIHNARLGRWMSVDPYSSKFSYNSTYCYVGNMPINAIDPDGRDIVVLLDRDAAHGAGHQAVLIGNDKDGWTYVSKDGADNGGPKGKSRYSIVKFNTLSDFKNSMHNFDIVENHSKTGGGETENPTYLLDANGNKIQRYEEAFYIGTTQADGSSTDESSLKNAIEEAKKFYALTFSDCSDVVTAALQAGESSDGKELTSGEPIIPCNPCEIPIIKQAVIEATNDGIDYDELGGITPENNEKQPKPHEKTQTKS